jgi:hypothetical protein
MVPHITDIAVVLVVARYGVPLLDETKPDVRVLESIVLTFGSAPLGETTLLGDAPTGDHDRGVLRLGR